MRMLEQVGDIHLLVPQCRQRTEIVAKTGNLRELAIGVRLVELTYRQKFSGEFIKAVRGIGGNVIEIAKHPGKK